MVTRPLAISFFALFLLTSIASAQSSYSTGFEPPEFVLGDVAGQNGWGHLSNSPTKGVIEAAPTAGFGAQSLAIRTRNVDFFGVANHLYSALINPAAGETGSTFKGTPAVDPQSHFAATVWVRTPDAPVISSRGDGRFAQLNPSSRLDSPVESADRYASVRFYNTTNTAAGLAEVRMVWIGSTTNPSATVATLQWGQWYRFEFLIHLVDGTNGAEPNDLFNLTIHDAAGAVVGSACGSTWELGWRSGSFGGGATPRAINGFDFWAETAPNNTLVYFVDNFSMSAFTPAGGPLAVAISGTSMVCAGGTTTLTANVTGGSGSVQSYTWSEAAGGVVGTGPTLVAGPGTYTVAVIDPLCASATSSSFTVNAFPSVSVSISGSATVGTGQTTTLTANPAGGSGTYSSYEWRNAANAVVGTGPTLNAGAGTYTVIVTDATCGSATSAAFTVSEPVRVPTLGTWGMIVMMIALAGTALFRMR